MIPLPGCLRGRRPVRVGPSNRRKVTSTKESAMTFESRTTRFGRNVRYGKVMQQRVVLFGVFFSILRCFFSDFWDFRQFRPKISDEEKNSKSGQQQKGMCGHEEQPCQLSFFNSLKPWRFCYSREIDFSLRGFQEHIVPVLRQAFVFRS